MNESVIDIMLNIKKLRFTMDDVSEKEIIISQTFTGVGLYTSDDIKLPSGLVLLNESTPLFEITDPSIKFTVDLRVEK